jgi:hypothetical protein
MLLCSIGLGHVSAQQNRGLNAPDFSVSVADDWNNLFKRSKGWYGGDGFYTIPLNGNEALPASPKEKLLFLFSDSMIGEINNGSNGSGNTMINNALAILNGKDPDSTKVKFYWKQDNGKPASVFVPHTPQTDAADYYWLGDGFVNQELKNLYIFGYRIRKSGSGAFGFKEVGNTLIKIKPDSELPYAKMEQMDTPFYFGDETGEMGSFGAGIFVHTKQAGTKNADGYIYVYGIRSQKKKLLVARVKPQDFELFNKWRFYDGRSWVKDMHQSAALTDSLSNEISMSQLPDGRYALIFQVNGITPFVGMRIGSSPVGPFGPVIKIWDCKADLNKNYFAYNAKAHPSISNNGELIISYNVNSFNFFEDLHVDPHLYRPRFIRMKFK